MLGEGSALPSSLDASSGFLAVGAELGLILLLLTLGLEFSADEFDSVLRRHVPSGVVDLAAERHAGRGRRVAAPRLVRPARWSWPASPGCRRRGSSRGSLSDLGRLANRETPSVLAILVLEDIAMAVVPAARGRPGRRGWPHVRWPSRCRDLGDGGPRWFCSAPGTSVTGSATGWPKPRTSRCCSGSSGSPWWWPGSRTLLDASAAVGAFLVGLALTGQAAERSRALLSPLRDVFAAVFFVSFGLSIDPSTLPPVLLAAAALAAVTLVTKVLTGWYAAGRDGRVPRGRMRAGLVLAARGEFAVVIAGLAVAAGLEDVGPVTAAYVLILAVTSPVLARFADDLARPFMPKPVPA